MTTQCDVCGAKTNKQTVQASGLAPVSYNVCRQCVEEGAEPIGVVEIWVTLQVNLADETPPLPNLKSYLNGAYIGWDQIRKHVLDHQDEIREMVKVEFGFSSGTVG
tara:strand:- start:2428 stop:2745 length:318 start_codon:yes stop_codon:yes gene_type:complete